MTKFTASYKVTTSDVFTDAASLEQDGPCEQPTLSPGGAQEIAPLVRNEILATYDDQTAKGLASYGVPLTIETHINAWNEALREGCDLLKYAKLGEMRNAKLLALLVRVREFMQRHVPSYLDNNETWRCQCCDDSLLEDYSHPEGVLDDCEYLEAMAAIDAALEAKP